MGAALLCGFCEPLCCLMIDPVVHVLLGKGVSDPREMHHGIAILQKGLPVKRHRQIREAHEGYIGPVKGGRCSGCSDYLVTLRRKVRHEMASDEAIAPRHKH